MRSARQVAKEEAAAEAKKKADEAAEAKKKADEAAEARKREAEEAEELQRNKNALTASAWHRFGRTLDCERSIARRIMFRKSKMMKDAEKWLIDNKAKIEEYETWKKSWNREMGKKSIAKKPLAAKNRWVIAPSRDKSDAIFQSRGLVNLSKPMSKGARKAAVMRMALDDL
uniref:Uncharacterized protein n=1 Tax=Micromonas pusilla TaxID=38833 RepID=A0A7S0IAR8_MICPS|mmetsp:Transcript_13828/g.58555  ORF Transcript_13828/g.58555 Transcript_13828/m.58555 type:complete len:171 (+) Transcript_13828:42-554(+)